MNKRNFPVHGELSLSLDGHMLVIEGEGPGNVEVAIQYQKDVQAFREFLQTQPWGSLVKLKGVPLLPPEAKLLMTESIKQARSMNLVATAVVLIDVEFADAARQFWSDIYEETGLTYRFFERAEDARIWLQKQVEANT